VVTSDLSEAIRISDRLQVVRNGTTTVEFGPNATQVDVLAAAAGDVSEQAVVTDTAAQGAEPDGTRPEGPT
jgi:rhamnose transport system ATP-binding protein